MKKSAIIFIILFSTTYLSGQSKLDTIYSGDVCKCLDSLKTRGLNEESLTDCLQKAMQQNSDLILEEVKKQYGDTSEESGNKFGKDLGERISISLVKSCKTYFAFLDSIRYTDYKNLNKDSVKFKLKNLEKIAEMKQHDELFSDKALLFFDLKMYDSSLVNTEKALAINSNNVQSLFIKGWINEINGNYDEAILLYNKVAELTNMKNFYIFSEIAKRKKSGM